MKQPLTVTQTIDSDFMIRSAFERIRQLEAELIRLRQRTTISEKFVWVNQSQKLTRVSLLDILYIMSESNYSRIFMKNGQQFFMSKTLKAWANEVSESDFLRCHRSYLVNRSEIVEINRSTYQVVLQNGQIIPVSRRKQKNDVRSIKKHENTGSKFLLKKSQCKVHKLSLNPIQ
jgi:DNA-binding LytR/AlgR family response regulator